MKFHKKHFLLSILFTGTSLVSWSQTTDFGQPLGWNGKFEDKNLPTEEMPGYDQSEIDAEDAINDQNKASVWRFGYKYNTNYSLDNRGQWKALPNGDRLWRLGIQSDGALTINLLFENVHLPEGSRLYLYDKLHTNYIGAYTSRNNRPDGLLGTELIHGDEIVVEYYEPKEVKDQGKFTINAVVHGYRSLNIVQDKLTKALNSSGDCNIDVNCPLGNGWDDQIRSVAMIVVNGNGACTGALINNTCDDGTPYFLTADHCLGAGGGTGNWAFRFNWNSPAGTESCATTAGSSDPGPPYDQTANGGSLLANSGNSDFALLEIDNMTLNDAQNWNVFYAGWDNTDDAVSEATGIHHPAGDVKKICYDGTGLSQTTWSNAQVWEVTDWDQGVTEGGSSGSPLFDQNGRIVGQLYGGGAACSGTNDNGAPDWYGRFATSWNLGVSNYLAPNTCGSATVDNGWDPNGSPAVQNDIGVQSINNPNTEMCVMDFSPEVVITNYGSNTITSLTVNYNIDGGSNNTYNWTGNLASGASTVVTLPLISTTEGDHTFNASTSNPNGNSDNDNSNDAISLSFFVGTVDVSLLIETDCWGSEVTWVIEDNTGNVVQSGGPYTNAQGGTSESHNFCLSNECYEFTISDDQADGMYGSQFGSCNVDGTYTITEVNNGNVLAELIAANADYGSSETNNFCITSTVSIDENNLKINIYPNPTNGIFTLETEGISEPITVIISDVSGRTLQVLKSHSEFTEVNLSGVSAGTYFIKVSGSSFEKTQRIVKK